MRVAKHQRLSRRRTLRGSGRGLCQSYDQVSGGDHRYDYANGKHFASQLNLLACPARQKHSSALTNAGMSAASIWPSLFVSSEHSAAAVTLAGFARKLTYA